MFRSITLKQLKSLNLIDMFSWLCCREVTLQTAMQKVPGSIPGSGKDIDVYFFVLLFLFFVPNPYLHIFLQFLFAMLIHYSIVMIQHKLWPITRVYDLASLTIDERLLQNC